MKKVLLDTNVILRLLIGDVPEQLSEAKQLFKEVESGLTTGLISILVINELVWILENFYQKSRKDYLPLLQKLFSLKNLKILEIKKKDLLVIFKQMAETNLDFTDVYLWWLAQERKIKISSFDKKLLKIC